MTDEEIKQLYKDMRKLKPQQKDRLLALVFRSFELGEPRGYVYHPEAFFNQVKRYVAGK